MEVTFNQPTDITVIQELKRNFTSITIDHMIDYPETKMVNVYIKEFINYVTLWQGAEYDAIGQWSDTDVINRIKELYQN